ncbi:hypothetical protein ABBQ32_007905 [Trebouxia sp. C0010 RCD-2024]
MDFDKVVALLDSEATVGVFAKSFKSNPALKHAYDRKGNTLLHLATARGNVDVVQFLLDHHALVAAANQEGQTALHLSALTTATKLSGALLAEIKAMPSKARSAVLNAKDSELGRTALHYAAKLGSHETIEQLTKAGCDADMLTKTKHTPLRSAAAQGHTAAVAALVSAHAKVSIPDVKGVNPLHAAASIGNMDVVAALLQGQDSKQAVQACDHRGCSVLHYAISSGKPATQLVPLLEALLQHGAGVDAADEQGTTALHQAAKSSPCAVVEALLAHHAAINQQDKVDGKTPLHYAAERGVQATVRALLDGGGSAVIADGQGRLPQHLASGKIQNLLLKEAEKQGGSPFKHRPASPSLSRTSRLSSSSVPQGLPFSNITNTPASRAATPAPADDVRASGSIKGIPRSGEGSRRRSQGLEDLQEQLQDVLQEGTKMQTLFGKGGAFSETKGSRQGTAQLAKQSPSVLNSTDRNNSSSKEGGKSCEPSPAPTTTNEGADAAVLEDERQILKKEVQRLRVQVEEVPGLQEQLARTQVALEQWKSNDSVQLESARHDVIRLRGQLEAQVESAKVASAQCKSAQSELKTLRQQIESRNQSSLSGQSELAWKGLLESAKQESATQLESVSRELKAQTELTRNTQAELSSVRHQLHCTKSELASVCEQHRSQTESSKTQQEQMQQRGHEQKSQAVWQAEQLKGSETELQEARRECQHLKRGKEQLVDEGDQKLEGQRAVVRAMTTQVESLQRQVASLNSLQAENEALKSTVEAKQRLLSDQEHILWSTHQSLTQTQARESSLQHRVSELQALQQTTTLRAEQLSKKGMQLTADKAAVESTLSLKENESNALQAESATLRGQIQEHQAHAAALQNQAAEQSRTISLGSLQLKQLQSKIQALEQEMLHSRTQGSRGTRSSEAAAVLGSPLWQQDQISVMQQQWVERLQRIKECCLPR